MSLFVDIEKVLQGFTLKVKFNIQNETLGLLGQSGCGKSMTLRCIAGIEVPTKGKIILNGKTLFDSSKGINLPIQKRKIGFLFQNYALFPHMTVLQNIQFGLKGLSVKERESLAKDKINTLQLNGLENRYPWQLSGGQQQRVAIARALAIEPEMLLLDEPFSALDNFLKSEVEKELLDIISTYRGSIIFVSHNMDEVYRICNNIMIISNGKEEVYGNKNEIFEKPPTLTAAKLTGCKNYSRVKIISDKFIEAIDWGCKVYIREEINGDISHVGIRAHHIYLSTDPTLGNVYKCKIVQFSETAFNTTVYLKFLDSNIPNEANHLQWEVSKDLWEVIKKSPEELSVVLPFEKVILMKDFNIA